jgi:hypothetical protein
MPKYAAIGRSGALRGAASDILKGASMLREQRKEKAAGEEAEAISKIRVPISGASTQAMPTSIQETIATKQESDIAQTQMQEQEQSKEAFEATRMEMQKQEEQQVQSVEELPVMKQLKETPTAYNYLMEIANANGWIENVGGVPTISNKQLKIAQGIISTDLKLNKDLNEKALGDTTQQITGLKQSMLDPKLKDEERAQAQAQVESLVEKQTMYLNAVNMLDREIQKELAVRKPTAPSVKTKELMYQDEAGNYRWGLLDESGNVVKDLRSATQGEISKGKGKALGANEYRQWVKQAETNAYKSIFANDPTIMQEIAQLESTEIGADEKARIEAKIHTALTPTQQSKLDELKETYFKKNAPRSVWDQYRQIKGSKRKPTKALKDPLGIR